jgi:phage-related protein
VGEGHLDVFKLQGIISIFGADKAKNEIDETTKHAERKGSKLLGTLSKIGAAAIAAGGAAVVAVGKQALLAYADYEQLVGGVDTLFKESSANVQKYAANAFKTAGLSANEYMETVTSFSASLLQSLGGDTEAAAKMADIAITDMSDNANKMGTDMASIQNAYQGFAKQNYTMLDNLKLGYGGTKEEMQRLINHANALNAAQGKLTNYSIDSYADIVSAIHDVQTEMGITGTTAEEASTTIQGSMNSMKGAWKNLLVGIADENANFKGLTSDFVDSLVTVGENLIPRINIIIEGLTQLITEASQTIIPLAVQTLLENLPSIIAAGMDLVMALVNGILNNINLVITCIINLVDVIVNKLIENLPKLIEGGVRLVIALAGGLIKAIPQLVARIPEIIAAIVQGFAAGGKQMLEVGVNIVKGVWEGIKSAAAWIKEKVTGFFSGIVDGVKGFLGIHSPSKVFAGIGGFMAKGLGEGFDDEFKSVKDDIESSMNFRSANMKMTVGGILEHGQVGLLEGTGAEAVVPLDQNRKWISAAAEDMNGSLGGNKQVQELKESFDKFCNDLPDMLIDAFTAMKFDVNNREFARLVKAVN